MTILRESQDVRSKTGSSRIFLESALLQKILKRLMLAIIDVRLLQPSSITIFSEECAGQAEFRYRPTIFGRTGWQEAR